MTCTSAGCPTPAGRAPVEVEDQDAKDDDMIHDLVALGVSLSETIDCSEPDVSALSHAWHDDRDVACQGSTKPVTKLDDRSVQKEYRDPLSCEADVLTDISTSSGRVEVGKP